MTVTYTAVVEFDAASGMYIGSVPQLPGALTQAASLDELRTNLKEVIELVLADMAAHGEEPSAAQFVGTQQLTITV